MLQCLPYFPLPHGGAFIIGIIKAQFDTMNYDVSPMRAFVEGIPYQYYTIGAVIAVAIFAIIGTDFGPMKRAEDRALYEGKVLDDSNPHVRSLGEVEIPEDANPTFWNMLAPVLTLIIIVISMFLWTGGFPERSPLEALGNANSMLSLNVAYFVAGILGFFLAIRTGVIKLEDSWNIYLQGVEQMVESILILILAWALGSICTDVGTADFIVQTSQNVLTPSTMLLVIFIAAAITGFTTGTSWGTFAIFIPIAIPLAVEINAPVGAAIAAAISGGIFGDHCSPISDTTILSSMGASCHHVDHVTTQLPYALLVAFATGIGYIITGYISNAFIGLGITTVLIFLFILIAGKITNARELENPESIRSV